MVSKRGFAEVVPLVEHVALAPGGGLWVQRRVPGVHGSGPIDVFDSAGAYVGTLQRMPMPAVFLSADQIGVIEPSEQGGQRLVLGRIVR